MSLTSDLKLPLVVEEHGRVLDVSRAGLEVQRVDEVMKVKRGSEQFVPMFGVVDIGFAGAGWTVTEVALDGSSQFVLESLTFEISPMHDLAFPFDIAVLWAERDRAGHPNRIHGIAMSQHTGDLWERSYGEFHHLQAFYKFASMLEPAEIT